MKKAAIYARFSSENQDEASIETQFRECNVKAEQLGAIVVNKYTDIAQSGRTDDRAGFKQMLYEAKFKKWEILIVRKFDRFARNMVDARLTEQHLEKYGVKLISCHEDFDTDSAGGWISKQMIHLINEWYSRNLAVETKSGMETNTLKGFRCGGTAPYGYTNKKVLDEATGKNRTVLEINPYEAEAVVLIFQRYSRGIGFAQIIKELNEKNLLPRKAKIWNKSQLSNMLRNETYAGVLTWKKSATETIRNEGAVPAIIKPGLWEDVKVRVEKSKKLTLKSRGSDHPLTGIVKCAKCGSNYVIHTKNGGRWRLCCTNNLRKRGCTNSRSVYEDTLIDKLKRVLKDRIFTSQNMRVALEQLKKELQPTMFEEEKLKKLKKEFEAAEQKQDRLMNEFLEGDLPKEVVKRSLEKLEDHKKGLLARIKTTQEEISRITGLKVQENDVEMLVSVAQAALKMDDSRLKSYFHKWGVEVILGKNSGKIKVAPSIFGESIPDTLSAGDGT